MDLSFLNALLSNQGLAVVIIVVLGITIYKIMPTIIAYFQERQSIKDKTEKERDERYSSLIDRTQQESKEREFKLNEMIEKTNVVNMEISQSNRGLVESNKELAESNRILVEGFSDVGNRMDKMETEVSQINNKLDSMNKRII